ncbi:hypothetical protein BY458DRAFT_520062 [Sporodiniella umbellata]|nr:hypothetical protein BY458DRAFT_520062 [Sporodiniella umbellata]
MHKEIVKNYLESTEIPNFVHFGKKCKSEIGNSFYKKKLDTSLSFQEYWRNCYNQGIITTRPKENIASKRKGIISPFKAAFEVYSNNNASFENFEYQSMRTLSAFSESSSLILTNMLKQKQKEQGDSSERETEQELSPTETEVEQEEEQGREADPEIEYEGKKKDKEEFYWLNERTILRAIKIQVERLICKKKVNVGTIDSLDWKALDGNKLSVQLLKAAKSILRQSNISATETEYLKLCVSNIISFVVPGFTTLNKKYIDNDLLSEIQNVKYTDHFCLESSCESAINEVFTSIEGFRFDKNRKRAVKHLDKLQYEEGNIESTKYQVARILKDVIFNMNVFGGDEKDLSEFTYIRKFEQILDVIFEDSNIVMKDGESGCQATKNNKILDLDLNDCEISRKVDLIFIHKRDQVNLELSNVEFKKSGASKQTKMCQHSKNARINACIFNDLMVLRLSQNTKLITIDWNGRYGYLYELCKIKDCIIARAASPLFIPKRLDEIIEFKETLLSLYKWKAHMISLKNSALQTVIKQKRKYSCIETVNIRLSSPEEEETEYNCSIFLTPESRRTRTANE